MTDIVLCSMPGLAVQCSINAFKYGVPFGGTMSWLMVVLMANDSGEYPYAPLQAALIGWPITILCDMLLLIPAIVIWLLVWMRL
jgi:hypothetical protein